MKRYKSFVTFFLLSLVLQSYSFSQSCMVSIFKESLGHEAKLCLNYNQAFLGGDLTLTCKKAFVGDKLDLKYLFISGDTVVHIIEETKSVGLRLTPFAEDFIFTIYHDLSTTPAAKGYDRIEVETRSRISAGEKIEQKVKKTLKSLKEEIKEDAKIIKEKLKEPWKKVTNWW